MLVVFWRLVYLFFIFFRFNSCKNLNRAIMPSFQIYCNGAAGAGLKIFQICTGEGKKIPENVNIIHVFLKQLKVTS